MEFPNLERLGQSISVLRVVWWDIFTFIQILIEHSVSNGGYPDQTPRHVASHLGMRLCICPIKRTLGLNGLKR